MLKKKNNIKKKLSILFHDLKIKRNDNVLLHSNSTGIIQYAKSKKNKQKLFKVFLNLLLKKIGKQGTLVVPTYNYDFTKGKTFVYEKYNSQVGELGNFFLKEYNTTRTLDPIFSHAIKGSLKKKLLESEFDISFGEESIFRKIRDHNFKIFGFCCPLNSMTFLHYIEKYMNVKYRFNKKFISTFVKSHKAKRIKINYFVGKRHINYKLKNSKLEKAFKNLKNFNSSDFGNFYCWSINSKICFKVIREKIKRKNNYLIK